LIYTLKYKCSLPLNEGRIEIELSDRYLNLIL